MKERILPLLALALFIAHLSARPVITSQPVNQMVVWGGNATFSVMATGLGPLTYQWQLNGTNLPKNDLITTVAGNGTSGFSGDGEAATNAMLMRPVFVEIDTDGNPIFSDSFNSRVRKVAANGIITTVAGGGAGNSGSGDGGAATNAALSFFGPAGVAVDAVGNLYFADSQLHKIRKVDTNGIIYRIAGTGIRFFGGDGGAATNAYLDQPNGVALDKIGNLFIADKGNHRIRKVGTNGIITTFAGTKTNGYSGDGGTATNASMSLPNGLGVDAVGNLFIADYGTNTIRKVDTNGIITTVAGTGVSGYSGDGGPAVNAKLGASRDVAVDTAGNLFIADFQNHCIRKVDTNGIITTVAGNGVDGYSGDGGAAVNAKLSLPTGVRLDTASNLFIADNNQNVIRKVIFGGLSTFALNNVSVSNLGDYQVIVTDSSGSVTSSVVTVNLQLPPITPAFTASNGTNTFTWNAVSNLTYQLQSATNLAAPDWIDLGAPITATNSSASATDVAGSDEQRFYRVRLLP